MSIDNRKIKSLETTWGQQFKLPDEVAALDARSRKLAELNTETPDYAKALADPSNDLSKTLLDAAKAYSRQQVLAGNVDRARNLVDQRRERVLNSEATLDLVLSQIDAEGLQDALNAAPSIKSTGGDPGKAIELGLADEYQRHQVAIARLKTLVALRNESAYVWLKEVPTLPKLERNMDTGCWQHNWSRQDVKRHQIEKDLVQRCRNIENVEADLINGELVADLPNDAEDLYQRIEAAARIGEPVDTTTVVHDNSRSLWQKTPGL